jgi:hypothetical protein
VGDLENSRFIVTSHCVMSSSGPQSMDYSFTNHPYGGDSSQNVSEDESALIAVGFDPRPSALPKSADLDLEKFRYLSQSTSLSNMEGPPVTDGAKKTKPKVWRLPDDCRKL